MTSANGTSSTSAITRRYELVTATALDSDNVPMVLYLLTNEIHSWEGDQKAFETEFEQL